MTDIFDISNIIGEIYGYPISYIELLATLSGLVSVYYASRASILTWPTGTLNAVFLFMLFFQVQLYADMFLQLYFFIVTLYGWYYWNRKKDDKDITILSQSGRLVTTAIVAGTTLIAGYLFSHIHEYLPQYFKIQAAYPYADSFIMTASITATTLLAQKKIENWYLWLMVNIASIAVYYAKEVYFLSLEYVVFFVLASYGLYNWHKNGTMVKAFLFGKFLPFHKGHEAMIRFALTHADFVSVLVCSSDKENIPAQIRKRWIANTFEGNSNIEVLTFEYKESDFPNTSVSSKEVSAIWAPVFSNLFPEHSLLITSEPYGDYVAEFMGIRHIAFDIPKQLYPVSATLIRNNVFEWWEYLPDSVKPFYTFKVTILGTESTGKTTLAQRLSAHFGCTLVNEAGRDIIPNSNSFTMDDLRKTATEHARRIIEAEKGNSPLVIIDTDVHITMSYGEFTFGERLAVNDTVYDANRAGLYVYLTNNSGYFQDGTRLDENQARLLDISHRKILNDHNIIFAEVGGSFDKKFEKAVQHIKALIKS